MKWSNNNASVTCVFVIAHNRMIKARISACRLIRIQKEHLNCKDLSVALNFSSFQMATVGVNIYTVNFFFCYFSSSVCQPVNWARSEILDTTLWSNRIKQRHNRWRCLKSFQNCNVNPLTERKGKRWARKLFLIASFCVWPYGNNGNTFMKFKTE